MPDWSQVFKRKAKAAKPDTPPAKKSALREWLESIVVAGGAAMLIRIFLIEAFMIPTPSMERSLMVGDFLFVSKLHYGARMPMVPLSIPFLHNSLPFTEVPSFVDWVTLPYTRLPGFSSVQRGDVIVFNFPAEDQLPNRPGLGPLEVPSVKENYIKRCVAIPGDSIRVVRGDVVVNGEAQPKLPTMKDEYRALTTGEGFRPKAIERMGLRPVHEDFTRGAIGYPEIESAGGDYYRMDITADEAAKFKAFDNVKQFERVLMPEGLALRDVYPGDTTLHWNIDAYGPLWVPKKGATIPLTPENISRYRRVIEAYEGHSLRVEGSSVTLDGQPATTYTFAMDYYFVMGDNRHRSQDSRIWGFVPEDHLVGKPLFVLFSWSGGPRWDRFFKGID